VYIHWWPPIGPGGQPAALPLSFDTQGNPLPLQPVGGTRLDYGNDGGGVPYISDAPGGVPLYFDAAGNPLPLQPGSDADIIPPSPGGVPVYYDIDGNLSPLQPGSGAAAIPGAYGGVSLVLDAEGNPLPVQPWQGGAPLQSGAGGSGRTAAAPVVLPWMVYSYDGGSQGALYGGGPDYSGPHLNEPPWSDALTGRPAGCCGGSSPLDWIKEHWWLCLAILGAAVVVAQRDK